MELMMLDEAIKHAEEVAKENRYEYQECVAVHDMEEAMVCGKRGEEHERLAKWLKDYKRLLERESCEDAISREEAIRIASGFCHQANVAKELAKLPSVNVPDTNVGKMISVDVLDKIITDIQKLRGCSCSCSDGIIDDVEDIIDKYKAESEEV